jgi:transglutaminase-like putative cysteine protease
MTTIPFRVGCELSYTVSGPSAFIFNVSVVNNAFQRIVEEQFTTEPQLEVEESRSPIEEKRHHRFSSSAGPLRVLYSATVELSHHVQSPDNVPQTPPGALPADVVPYLYPSRYCESDKLVRLAQHEFGKLQPGFSRVTAICNWIHNNVEYLRGATNPQTSAYDIATERAGVCRDFAHLAATRPTLPSRPSLVPWRSLE